VNDFFFKKSICASTQVSFFDNLKLFFLYLKRSGN
jgi:hypothetical protein